MCVVLLIFLVKEPARGGADGAQMVKRSSWFSDVKDILKMFVYNYYNQRQSLIYFNRFFFSKTFVLITLGFTWVSFALGSLSWWGPIFLEKSHVLANGSESEEDKEK